MEIYIIHYNTNTQVLFRLIRGYSLYKLKLINQNSGLHLGTQVLITTHLLTTYRRAALGII